MSREIPILFSTSMVQAILEGRKSQTRRIVKPQPVQQVMGGGPFEAMKSLGISDDPLGWTWKGTRWMPWPESILNMSPYGKTGDRLWVRETWAYVDFAGEDNGYVYRATDPDWETTEEWRWRPSIHMPKAAARIWLEVTEVRVERLQEISEEDAIAEGVETMSIDRVKCYRDYGGDDGEDTWIGSPTISFETLWQSINGAESWEQNPFVWVIKFKRL